MNQVAGQKTHAIEDVATSSSPSNEADSNVRRNFWVLTFYLIVQRIGWIFKTESIIIPAVLDSLTSGGSAWLRGFLPMLNRIGQSIPPVILSDRVRRSRYKSKVLAICSSGMAVTAFGFSCLWLMSMSDAAWAPYYFLVVYGCFFIFKGMSDLAFGSLQGKLIPVTTRGRLLLSANSIGALIAIFIAAVVLSQLIDDNGGRFDLIFSVTAFCFLITSLIAMMSKETADLQGNEARRSFQPMRDAITAIRSNRDFRILASIGFLFGISMMLFPHYQALARGRLGLSFDSLVTWVIVQNIGTGVFSIVIGLLADRCGNRLVLRMALSGIMVMPLLALWLTSLGVGSSLFAIVFVLFGLTPVTIKLLSNYTLELSDVDQQPRYLSTIGLSISVPIFFSPFMGSAIEYFDFDLPFIFVSMVVACAVGLCFLIGEPRQGCHAVKGC